MGAQGSDREDEEDEQNVFGSKDCRAGIAEWLFLLLTGLLLKQNEIKANLNDVVYTDASCLMRTHQ